MRPARRIACLYTHPMHLRAMRPLAAKCRCHFLTDDVVELANWHPDVVVTNDAGQLPQLRRYADGCHAFVVGLRHGAANKYIGPDPEYALADYVCGSDFDERDFRSHGVWPRRGFLLTGNPWMDDLFSLPVRHTDRDRPTVLLAPTYNPETSALGLLSDRFVSEVRKVYPESRILIKPHPLVFEAGLSWVRKTGLAPVFRKWVSDLRRAARDPLVRVVEDPAVSIAECFGESDLLVSDGSSLVFEFMALNRPILLYSSRRRVHMWKETWDPGAPGNAWRDVGSEFCSCQGFRLALREAFHRHDTLHAERQREYSHAMYGRWRDGKAAERIAATLEELPRLPVRIVGRGGTAAASSPAGPLRRVVRNATVLQSGADRPEAGRTSPAARGASAGAELAALSFSKTKTTWMAHVGFLDAAMSLLHADPSLDGVIHEGDDASPSTPGSVWRRDPEQALRGGRARVGTLGRVNDPWVTSLVRQRHAAGRWSSDVAALVLYARNDGSPGWQRFEVVRFDVARPAGAPVRRVRIRDAQTAVPRKSVLVPASPASRKVFAVVGVSDQPARVEIVVDARPTRRTPRAGSGDADPTAVLVSSTVPEHWHDVLNPARTMRKDLWAALCARERLEADRQCEAAPGPLRWPDGVAEPGMPFTGEDSAPAWLRGLRVLVPWTAWRCRQDRQRRVAFFGAGRHSAEALSIWRVFRGPSVRAIVVSKSDGPCNVCGVPVLAADEFDARAVDAIVLSSAVYEPEMAAVCRARWPGVPTYAFWGGTTTPGSADVERRVLLARAALPWIAGRAHRDRVERVVLVAGAEARFLVPIWWAWQGPRLAHAVPGIGQHSPLIPGLPTVSPGRVRLGPREAILLASAHADHPVTRQLSARRPDVRTYHLPY
jgi:CDP-glycerol glycerophosphotransferase (TagB/SpsB family)